MTTMRHLILTTLFVLLQACRQEAAVGGQLDTNSKQQATKNLQELDPIVFNTLSLYKQQQHEKQTDITRPKRSLPAQQVSPPRDQQQQLVDACQSKMEILTPYYGKNSKGKLRTIINSDLMQQAIQVETCIRSPQQQPAKCNAQPDCGCEQKYKWHRLLVLDPRATTNSQALFMDWFLFPSNCVCRCKSGATGSKQSFLRTIKAA